MKQFNEDVVFTGRVQFGILPDNPVDTLIGTTPDVSNRKVFRASGDTVTITNFTGGAEGQSIDIKGDGTTTVQNNANIVTSEGADLLLETDVIYTFVYIDDVWYQKKIDSSESTEANQFLRGVYVGISVGTTTGLVQIGDLVELNGISKLTLGYWYRLTHAVTALGDLSRQTVFSRHNDTVAAGRQLVVDHESSQGQRFVITDAAAASHLGYVAGALTVGRIYKCFWVYDGTLSGNANRLKLYRSYFDFTTKEWTAQVLETLTFSGTIPATFRTIAGPVLARIGQRINGNNAHQLQSLMYGMRVWIGDALTSTEVEAETLDSNPIVPDLMYPFAGDADNYGTLSSTTYDGILVGGAALI